MQITAKIAPKQMRAPHWRPFRFVYPPRKTCKKTTEKNHAEKTGTELRIRHV
jgi:hypothetical protein